MSLFTSELRRFFARRLVRVMLLVVLGLLAVAAISTAVRNQRSTQADLDNARHQVAVQQGVISQQRAACLREQADPRAGNGDFGQLPPGVSCAQAYDPSTVQLASYLPSRWDFAARAGGMLELFAGLLALLAFAVGASFVGAEWSSGGMVNLLLWQPRRLRLLGTKLGALAAAVLLSGLALLVAWVGMLCVIALTRGYFGHVTPGLVRSLSLLGARAFGLGLVAAFLGFAIASIGRATSLALGIAIGYVVIVEVGARIVLQNVLRVDHPEKFLLSTYFSAWLSKGRSSAISNCTIDPVSGEVCVTSHWSVGMYAAGGLLAVIAVALLAWAFTSFRRNDVA
ncbi:MAG TPA: ABC transporter permease subunit [Micromonosporaceae bacterium]|nr:ABC transporter permease subunit [Micromonosporaceae bacterium]